MRFPKKPAADKAKKVAYRKEAFEHKWVLTIFMALAALLTVYYFFTGGAMSGETYAALLFLIIGAALVADLMHKRNLKMLRFVVLVFCVSLLAGGLVGGLSHAVQPAYAYTNANGAITSSNGEITVSVPYVALPALSAGAISCAGSNGPVCSIVPIVAGPTAISMTWFEDAVFNIGIEVVNAMIYLVNLIIVVLVDSVGAIISLPVSLFNAISVTTLGPVVDFLSFIPVAYAWIASVVVWAIALTEWIIIIIALVRLMRVAIGAASSLTETEESSVESEAEGAL